MAAVCHVGLLSSDAYFLLCLDRRFSYACEIMWRYLTAPTTLARKVINSVEYVRPSVRPFVSILTSEPPDL